MKVFGVWFICQLLLLQIVFSQEISGNNICWNEQVELKWSDFQGKPALFSTGKAGCAAELRAIGFWEKDLPNFRISNCFDRSTSWTTDTLSNHLLEHEKLHFDIAEIHARKMRKSIDSLRKEGVSNFDPYSKMIQYLLDRRNSIDSLYDSETAHGIYSTEQEKWKEKIWDELETLDTYEVEYD